MVGKTLGHYEILEPLGAGGMGEVYRARDTKLDRDVAIKVLPEDFATDQDRLTRFEREAKLLASLNHANIATIYGLEDSDGVRFIAMELVEGETLAEKIAQQDRIDVDEALEIARQIAEAFEAAHENGVIHRDLKPANVKVTPAGKVKVLDFGLAKAYEADGSLSEISPDLSHSPTMAAATRTGIILGTAAYMSPEQARGKPVDRRTDIWAFGCVLYEMLVGKRAFAGETVSDTLAAILKEEPDWRRLPPDTPASMAIVLRRCLQKDPVQRLHHLADARIEFDDDFHRAEVGEASARREAAASWKRIVPWAITTATILTGVAIWSARPLLPVPVSAHVTALPPSVSPLLGSFSAGVVGITPDGSRVLYFVGEDEGAALYAKLISEDEGRQIAPPGSIDLERGFAVSPDSRNVAFMSADTIWKIPIDGGPREPIADIGSGVIGISWGTENTIVLGEGRRSGLARVSIAGGYVETLTVPNAEAGELSHRFPQLLSDGQTVLFSIQLSDVWEDSLIGALDLESRSYRIIEGIQGTTPRYVPTGHLLYARLFPFALFAAPFNLTSLELTGLGEPVVPGLHVAGGFGAAHYSVSNTGTLAYVLRQQAAELEVVRVERDGRRQSLWVPAGPYVQRFALSADGQRLALTDSLNLLIYDLGRDGSSPVRFVDSGRATFGPDGPVFRRWQDDDVAVGPFDTVQGFRSILKGGSNPWPTSVSPDGHTVLIQQGFDETGWDLFSVDVDGGEVTEIAGGPGSQRNAKFSPSGDYIAYYSSESGSGQIYVRQWPVRDSAPILVTSDGGDLPEWSPDGSELFYISGSRIMAVRIETEQGLRVGDPVEVVSGGFETVMGFQVTPDGAFLVMRVTRPSPPRSIRLILNWFQELNDKVPVREGR